MKIIEELLKGKVRKAILEGNALDGLRSLPDDLVQCVVTSPPYFGLRNYGTTPQLWRGDPECDHEWIPTTPRRLRSENDVIDPNTIQNANKGANHALHPTKTCLMCDGWLGELGHEPTPEMFVGHLVDIFREVKRVLRPDGVCWINIADSYWAGKGKSGQNGSEYQEARESLNRGHHQIAGKGLTRPQDGQHAIIKPKDLCLVPQRLAIELQRDGWYVRSEVIWSKNNCMPESMEDRCTRSHEQIWMITKEPNYYYDCYAVRDGESANKRTVWRMPASMGFRDHHGAHHASFPIELPLTCIMTSTSEKGRCRDCSKPWRRIVQKTYPQIGEARDNAPMPDVPDWYGSGGTSFRGHSGYKKSDGTSMVPTITTLGWEADCSCGAGDPLPCIVMDIFNGSGTSGLAALRNNRSYIGLELNNEYIQMTNHRFNGGSSLLEILDAI